jgi:hypothetical protein
VRAALVARRRRGRRLLQPAPLARRLRGRAPRALPLGALLAAASRFWWLRVSAVAGAGSAATRAAAARAAGPASTVAAAAVDAAAAADAPAAAPCLAPQRLALLPFGGQLGQLLQRGGDQVQKLAHGWLLRGRGGLLL